MTWSQFILRLTVISVAVMFGSYFHPAAVGKPLPGEHAILGAQVKLPPGLTVDAAFTGTAARARGLIADAHTREAEWKSLPGWRHVESLEAMLAEINRFYAAGDFARAYALSASWTFEALQQQLIAGTIHVTQTNIPFLVLGPFGDLGFTATNLPGCPIVSNFNGLSQAYLGEIANTQCVALAADFRPDLTRTYPVYPNRMAGWQSTMKNEYLSFDDTCAQPGLWLVAYAYTEIFSPEKRAAAFMLGSEYSGKNLMVWVNGGMVSGVPSLGRLERVAVPDERRVNCELQPGWNRVLIKVVQRRGSRIYLRLVRGWEGTDRTSMHDLKFRVPGKEMVAVPDG